MGPILEREALFSKKTPVPMLGCYDNPEDTVEAFYDFWYNFDSWWSFEYLDTKVNEGSDVDDIYQSFYLPSNMASPCFLSRQYR